MNFDDVLPSFIAEATELLREMETGLLDCSRGEATEETINLIFRTAHTIKGSAGLFGLDAIVSFVHGVETLLDRVRLGEVSLDPKLVQVLLECQDHIATLVAGAAEAKHGVDAALLARSAQLLSALGQSAGPVKAAATETVAASGPQGAGWQVSLRFSLDVLMGGMDPLAFIKYLTTFGTISELTVVDEDLPRLSKLDPLKCHLGFEITLLTSEGRDRVVAAFEFVKDDCTLKIEPLGSSVASNEAIAEAVLTSTPAGGAARKQQTKGTAESTVRVDAEKLDSLITRIGELIIAAAGANMAARRSGSAEVEERLSVLSSLVEEVRGGALQLRMVKIGGTFNRFSRVVHDVSRELGKEINLVVSGEDTELDKTLVERITDPLTHLVRNAIDHGIEPADVRIARDKPAAGTVRLNAYHDSGTIVIEVSDDGGGLKRDRILAKAQERGLDRAGAHAHRRRHLQPDLRTGILHRREGDEPVRPWRRHGRRETQHHRDAR